VERQLRNIHPFRERTRRIHRAREGARRTTGIVMAAVLGIGMLGALIVARAPVFAPLSAVAIDIGDDASDDASRSGSFVGKYHVRKMPPFGRHRSGRHGRRGWPL